MNRDGLFKGVFTIPLTTFGDDYRPDMASFRDVIEFCLDCGADGLVYPVTASDFYTLSETERMELSEILVAHNAGRVPTVIGVSGVSKEVASAFAAHAGRIGADAVMAMPPYVRRVPLTDQAIFDYYEAISEASDLPLFVQDYVPPLGTEMSADFMLRLCREIEHVEYIKEESISSTAKISYIHAHNHGACSGVFGGGGGRYLIQEHREGSVGTMPACHATDVVVALWSALESEDQIRAMQIYKELAPLFLYEQQAPGTYQEVLKRRGVVTSSRRRNGDPRLDDGSSQYLDEILDGLKPLMTWPGRA